MGILTARTGLLAAAAVALAGGVACAEPSRCTLGEAKFMSWAPRERPWTLKAGLLHLNADPGKTTLFHFNRKNDARLLCAYASGSGFRISFKYRSTVRATLEVSVTTMEKTKAKREFSLPLPASGEWRQYSNVVAVPMQDCEGMSMRIRCDKGTGFIEMKDMSVVDEEPADKSGKPLLVNGARAEEVCLYASGTPRRRENELRAALMFRFALRAAGGEWLPVREVSRAEEAGANAVLVGRLAVDSGVVAEGEQAKVEGLTGGWAVAAKGARLGLAGAVPGGVQRGAWRVLERLGIVYLGTDMFKCFQGDAFRTDDFTETTLPAVAFPVDSDRCGQNSELRGWVHWPCYFGDAAIGSVPETSRLMSHTLGYIVPLSEFRDTHPEYFALQADGTRLTDPSRERGLTHYCWTAPGLVELVAARYLEMMRALPEGFSWPVMPGDGGGFYCKCERCKALGSVSDCMVWFLNSVAEITSREFPDNKLLMFSYVDTPEPPTKRIRTHRNVCVDYCVYPPAYWPSCMLMPHPSNERGVKAVAAWRSECCPNLNMYGYHTQCGEWLNFWPGFDANVWLVRDFASHRCFSAGHHGMRPSHRNGIIAESAGFADLNIYVMARLEVDPSQDALALAHGFIDDYYGAAAGPMRAFFDVSSAEPRRRDWIQGCEQHLRGFVTKEFAAKVFPLLDEAESIASVDPALLLRVRKQSILFYWSYLDAIGRGRGNVSGPELAPWARRAAHFAKMCRENGMCYMGNILPKQWFRETMLCDIAVKGKTTAWTSDPSIRAIIADPEKALARPFPTLQKKTPAGWEIPAAGMMGGEFSKKCFWRSKTGTDARVARRESSGLGLVFTSLDLDAALDGPVKMVLSGIDNDKAAAAEIEVKINGRVVYAGPVKWGKDAHSDWTIDLPAGLLKAGSNEIQFRNTTKDTEKDGEGGDAFRAVRNYYWGWFMLDKVAFVPAGK